VHLLANTNVIIVFAATFFRLLHYKWVLTNSHLLKINNGNMTEWTPVRSVIIRVINKIGRPHSGSPICLITSITDQIGWHEVLLPINYIYNKIRERKRRKPTGERIDNSFICEIRFKKSARSVAYCPITSAWRVHCPITLSNCPINAQIMAGDSQSDSRILL